MDKLQTVAFTKLREILSNVEKSAANLPSRAQELAKQMSVTHAERLHTYQTLTDQMGNLAADLQAECEHVAEASHRTTEVFNGYVHALQQSAEDIAYALQEGPQSPHATIVAFGESLFSDLDQQRQRLFELNDIESRADQIRVDVWLRHHGKLDQANMRLGEIGDTLTRAGEATASAMQAEQRLETQGFGHQALALNQQAARMYYQGFRQTALVLLEQAVQLAPVNVSIWLNLVHLCLEAGRIEQAVNACQEASRLAPDSVEVLYAQGAVTLRQGDLSRSIEILERCVELESSLDEVTFRLSLAEAYYANGHPQRAVEQWHRVLEIEPMQSQARAWLQAIE